MAFSFLNDLVDPRHPCGRIYEFHAFLGALVLAELSGCMGVRAQVRWLNNNLAVVHRIFGVHWKRAPGFTAVRHFLGLLGAQPAQLRATPVGTGVGCALSVDGKALRGSARGGAAMTYITSVFSACDGVVLAQIEHKAGFELHAAREALAELPLAGAWVTLDALHCEKKASA